MSRKVEDTNTRIVTPVPRGVGGAASMAVGPPLRGTAGQLPVA